MPRGIPNLSQLLPTEGLQWCDILARGFCKTFLTNAQCKTIVRSMRSYLPGLTEEIVSNVALKKMFDLCTENMQLCGTMSPVIFFDSIKDRYAWMMNLDGTTLYQLFLLICTARDYVTDLLHFYEGYDEIPPPYLTSQTELTRSIDEFGRKFYEAYKFTPVLKLYFPQDAATEDIEGAEDDIDEEYVARAAAWRIELEALRADRMEANAAYDEMNEDAMEVDDTDGMMDRSNERDDSPAENEPSQENLREEELEEGVDAIELN